MRSFIALVLLACVPAGGFAADRPALRQAIEKGLFRVEAGAANYTTRRDCFSCHHQALPLLAMTEARRRGFDVALKKIDQQVEFTAASFRHRQEQVARGQGVGGASTTTGYALWALSVGEYKPDAVTSAMVKYLLLRQRPDGSWPAQAKRPPSEGSPFTATGVALMGLKSYGVQPHGEEADAKELAARVKAAMEKARGWLLENTPGDTEEKVFHLIGLLAVEGPATEIAKARDRLLKEHREDGGWGQMPGMNSDAYATGSVLVALRWAGLDPTHDAYRKGVQFLLKSQREDGAWVVETRSRPIQTFFDNGDAGGKSQFISMSATSWAVLALLLGSK